MVCSAFHSIKAIVSQVELIAFFLETGVFKLIEGLKFFIRITTVGDIMHMYVIWSEVYVQAGVNCEYTLVDVIRVRSQARPCT